MSLINKVHISLILANIFVSLRRPCTALYQHYAEMLFSDSCWSLALAAADNGKVVLLTPDPSPM